MVRSTSILLASAVALLLSAGPAPAQAPAVTEARRLQEARDFGAAVRVLREHLARHPDDGDAARLLAQTLYWMQDVAGARATYEAGLERHPHDEQLRVDYARMLAEIGARRAARRLLAPLAATTTRADVHALLGTLAYWGGDFRMAARLFERTLQIDPAHEEARRQLHEIRGASAPWLRVSPAILDDDQPLTRAGIAVDAGVSLTPVTALRIAVQADRHSSAEISRRTWTGEAGVRHYAPAVRLEMEAAGGLIGGPVARSAGVRALGRAGAAVRLPDGLTMGARIERAPYLATAASLTADILTDTSAGELVWNSPRGWLARAAILRQRFPDGNTVRVRYAWAMAPLVRTPAVDLQAGYAAAYEDAEESRFTLAAAAQPVQPADPRFDVTGRYDPYYTPEQVLRQSILAATRVRVGSRGMLRLNGSLAVQATEDAPHWLVVDGVPARGFARRDFDPWEARGSFDVRLAGGATLAISVAGGRAAFYRWTSARVDLTYRFPDAARVSR